MSFNYHDFPKLNNAADLEKYMSERVYHKYYCHYTSLGVIDTILESKKLWVGNVSKFNDITDRKVFPENEQNRYFSLCFATGENENLPLWYLYSGISGKGGRIRLTDTMVKKLISKATFKLCQFTDENCKKIDEENGLSLEKDIDFELDFRDILYCKQTDKEVSLKYNNLTNYNFSNDEIEAYKCKHVGFYKTLIWFYEKEIRLLIRLTDNCVNRCEFLGNAVITMSIDEDVYKRISIDLAPEIKELSEIKGYKNIEKFRDDTSSIELSKYNGQLEFKLCDKCQYKTEEKQKADT